MKSHVLSLVASFSTVAVLAAWSDVRQTVAQPNAPGAAAMPEAGNLPTTTGKVVETMNAGSYTYVQVDDGSKKIWAAGPKTTVAVGDTVTLQDANPMPNFVSKTLGKTFDVVYFVSNIQVVGGKAENQAAKAHGTAMDSASPHGPSGHGPAAAPASVDLSNIKKADGGQTVGELFTNKATLAGKDVSVRGRVVKFTPAVMGKNWMHVQDGSGSSGTNDLTVSTDAEAAVGNMVLVRGKLVADKDLGSGYRYDIVIEDASVKVE